jgi:hypothetical protein
MTSASGRTTVSYIAKCALPAGDYIDKQDNTGTSYRFYGSLGFGPGWKTGSCDKKCQEFVSACVLAHINSTGNHVPLWITADPTKAPGVGYGQAWTAGMDQHIAEGSFFGNIFTAANAYYAAAKGFRGSIPGRLGASSTNPYKPWQGYEANSSNWLSGVASGLCMEDVDSTDPDGVHTEVNSCGGATAPNSYFVGTWQYVVNTHVNSNYNGATAQTFAPVTINFEGVSPAWVTNTPNDNWVATNNFTFANALPQLSAGGLQVADVSGSRRICPQNGGEYVTLMKNSGEPFSLVSLKHLTRFGGTTTITLTGYKKGATRVRSTFTISPTASTATLNWDGLTKVEITAPYTFCVDDLALKI